MLKLYDLTVEYKTEPLGLDDARPRFSWKLQSDRRDTRQAAYRLVVSGGGESWDTGRVESARSILTAYESPALTPRAEYAWQVTVWTDKGEEATAASRFETGLLSGAAFEGKARWITHGLPKEETASPVFTKTFAVTKPLAKARLYATACGLYEAEINGEKADDAYFAPGWTSYRKRLQYQTYAVKNLREGENTLRFTLGEGWYKSPLGFYPTPNHYGDTTALLAMLVLTYADGAEETVGTDESWDVSTGPIRFSQIYDGETQDTTLCGQPVGRALPFDGAFGTLVAQENEPVRCLRRLPAARDFIAPNGERLFDFAQNLTGWAEVKVRGRKGQKITLRHAESLDENGNFYTGNLSMAKAADTYILNGGMQTLRPHFTFHGFRYICLEGLEEGQTVGLTACHLSSDLREAGSFRCSDARVNRLRENIVWGQRDNYLDVPTDCPQRRPSTRTSCPSCANGCAT